MKEKRKYSRLSFPSSTTLIFEGTRFEAHLLDISVKGALLETPKGWPGCEKSFCTVVLVLNENDVSIQMEMEISHFRDNTMGLHCLSIDLESMTHLRKLLELNLGDPNLVERELTMLG